MIRKKKSTSNEEITEELITGSDRELVSNSDSSDFLGFQSGYNAARTKYIIVRQLPPTNLNFEDKILSKTSTVQKPAATNVLESSKIGSSGSELSYCSNSEDLDSNMSTKEYTNVFDGKNLLAY